MAQLSTHLTLDILVATVADLELRVTELKRAANTLASMYSLDLPYMDVGTVTQPVRRESSADADSDSQD